MGHAVERAGIGVVVRFVADGVVVGEDFGHVGFLNNAVDAAHAVEEEHVAHGENVEGGGDDAVIVALLRFHVTVAVDVDEGVVAHLQGPVGDGDAGIVGHRGEVAHVLEGLRLNGGDAGWDGEGAEVGVGEDAGGNLSDTHPQLHDVGLVVHEGDGLGGFHEDAVGLHLRDVLGAREHADGFAVDAHNGGDEVVDVLHRFLHLHLSGVDRDALLRDAVDGDGGKNLFAPLTDLHEHALGGVLAGGCAAHLDKGAELHVAALGGDEFDAEGVFTSRAPASGQRSYHLDMRGAENCDVFSKIHITWFFCYRLCILGKV